MKSGQKPNQLGSEMRPHIEKVWTQKSYPVTDLPLQISAPEAKQEK
jgi:hypothetical protein